MSARSFLDTNIFIYSVDRIDSRKAKIALRIIKEQAAAASGVISFQVVQEFFNVAFKRFPQKMTVEDCRSYLDAVFRPFLRVHSAIPLYEDALRIRGRYQLSWYDSLIVAAAIEGSCTVLYSEDLQHGAKYGDVRVLNPFRAA
ncbi:MAG TPA: PIN domain-containing protein [Bryobacteraceae bacterium]|nr:PIN domain-containing protein [Bryobacteraceae bacterium]